MGFFDFIGTIQQKPEQVRKRILVVSVVIIMTAVIGLWLGVTGRALSSDAPPREALFKDFSADISSPFLFLRESLNRIIKDAQR
jgi:hypothetical protein